MQPVGGGSISQPVGWGARPANLSLFNSKEEIVMKVVTLQEKPKLPVEGAERIDGEADGNQN